MGTFGGIAVVNLFSLRATDPRGLRSCPDPVGTGNDSFIVRTCQNAVLVVAAWGAHGAYLRRGAEVTARLAHPGIQPFCLGATAGGHPRHPGRMAYATALEPFGDRRLTEHPDRSYSWGTTTSPCTNPTPSCTPP